MISRSPYTRSSRRLAARALTPLYVALGCLGALAGFAQADTLQSPGLPVVDDFGAPRDYPAQVVANVRAGEFRVAPGDTLLLDALGQVYSLGADGATLAKLRSANQLAGVDTLRYRYRDVRLGRIASVDLTNPLRPVVFFADAQVVVWLNRNLTEQRRLDLLELGLAPVDAAAYAPNDGLWVFEPDRQRLLRLDRNGAVDQESVELNRLLGMPVRARELAATPQQVALAIEGGRVLLFGPFGAYRTQLLRPASALIADDDRLVFREGADLFRYADDRRLIEPVTVATPARTDADGAGADLPTERPAVELVAVRGEWLLYRRGDRWWVQTVPPR